MPADDRYGDEVIDRLRLRVKELRDQLLRLINCSASLLAHTPDFPTLSDGGTAQEFLRSEIKRASDKLKTNETKDINEALV